MSPTRELCIQIAE
jgi:ATP-dependent RNA helicase DDX47/RRP3